MSFRVFRRTGEDDARDAAQCGVERMVDLCGGAQRSLDVDRQAAQVGNPLRAKRNADRFGIDDGVERPAKRPHVLPVNVDVRIFSQRAGERSGSFFRKPTAGVELAGRPGLGEDDDV